jgi:hypothetical protein
MSESNGTATTEAPAPAPTPTTRNRMKPVVAGTKFDRLFALAGRLAEKKAFTVSRKTGEGESVQLKMDGYPTQYSEAGIAELAANVGGKVAGKKGVGEAGCSFTGVLTGAGAATFVRDLLAE